MDTLRSARLDEIDRLNGLISASARELSRGYYTSQQVDALIAQVFGVDTQLLRDQTYYVIERDGELLACGGWSHRRTLFGGDQAKAGTDSDLDPRTEAARIRAFFVHPSAARRGLGRRLLAHCEQQAFEAGFQRAELMATLPGEPLYRAAGYQAVDRVSYPLAGSEAVEFVRMVRVLSRA